MFRYKEQGMEKVQKGTILLLKNAQRAALLIIAIALLTKPFMPVNLTHGVSLLALALFCFILPTVRPQNRRLPIIIIAAALFVQWATDQNYSTSLVGASSMLDIVTILLVMQLFSIPIQLGTYTRDFEYLLFKYIKKEQGLFFFTTLITHFFATFLLFGTIPVMLSLLGEPLKNNVTHYERFAATAMSRGYALMISWSPGAVMFLLVSTVTHLEWNEVFLPGLLLSILGIATSVFIEGRRILSKQNIVSIQPIENVDEKQAWRSVFDIILVVISMIALIYLLEVSKMFTSTYCVMLSGLVIFSLWMIKYVKKPCLKNVLKNYWQEGFLKATDLTLTFIAIGILTESFKNANLMDYFSRVMGIGHWGFGLIALIPFIVISLSIIGLHPMITVTLIGSISMSVQSDNTPLAIALALLLGAIISFVVSPLTGIILTLANFLNTKASQISLSWNGLFSLVYLFEGILLIYAWAKFFV